jgi:hypothetical protein
MCAKCREGSAASNAAWIISTIAAYFVAAA